MDIRHSKATANLVMALASYVEAHSVVELSLSPIYQYQFSSISKAIHHLCEDEDKRAELLQNIETLCMSYINEPDFYLMQTDTTPYCKPHSPTLADRGYIAIPNTVIPGNRPLDIGYSVSCINLSVANSKWSLPLSMKRVPLEETSSECALKQIDNLINHPNDLFKDKTIVNTSDSKYGNAYFLEPAYQHANLLNILRLRAGMKVWSAYDDSLKRCRKRVYGEKYYLHRSSKTKTFRHPKSGDPINVFQRSIFESTHDEHQVLESQTAKGRTLKIELWRFNNMMLRSKDGHNMKDKPFDLVVVEATDAQTGKRIFDREMYIGINGQQKNLISLEEAYHYYMHRYDIEPYFRFAKQRLFFEAYQTPEKQHLDNWLIIEQLVAWLLFTASDETGLKVNKWEKYLPENKPAKNTQRLSIAQTRKSLQSLLLTLDLTPFAPLKSKPGKGRKKGTVFEPRQRYRWVKKMAHKRKSSKKQEQLE